MVRKILLRYIKATFLLFLVGIGCAVVTGVWIEQQIVIDLQGIFRSPRTNPTLVPHDSIQVARADFTVEDKNGSAVLAGELIANFSPNQAMYVSVRGDNSEQSYLWIEKHCYQRGNNDWTMIDDNSTVYCTLFPQIHTLDDLLRVQGISTGVVSRVLVPNSRGIIDRTWVDAYSVATSNNPPIEEVLTGKPNTPSKASIWIGTDDGLPCKLSYSLNMQEAQ